jgi:hypothetical protein
LIGLRQGFFAHVAILGLGAPRITGLLVRQLQQRSHAPRFTRDACQTIPAAAPSSSNNSLIPAASIALRIDARLLGDQLKGGRLLDRQIDRLATI